MRGPFTVIADRLDGIAVAAGRIAAWAAVLLMVVIVFDVITRRFFVLASTKLQDFEWHLHAVLFLMSLGYAYVRNAHVRIDILQSRLSPRTRAWIELLGAAFLLVPFCVAVLWYGWNFVSRSYLMGESSASQTGLSHRWIIKSFLLAGFALLLVSAAGSIARQIAMLRGEPQPGTENVGISPP